MDSDVTPETTDSSVSTEEVTSQEPQTEAPKGNPAWDEFRSELDPISFSRVEPILKKWDAGTQQALEARTKEFSWAKELQDAGRDPAYIQQSLVFADQLNENPEAVYEKIGEFLKANGRMPNKAESTELAKEVEAEQDPDTEADPIAEKLKKIDEFEANQKKFLEEQAQKEAADAADKALTDEIESLKTAHPEYDKDDIMEILGRAALKAQNNPDGDIKLEDVATEYQAFLDRVRSVPATPRPGDSAPKLVPTSGGVPSSQPAPKLGDLSRQDTIGLVASMMEAQNKS